MSSNNVTLKSLENISSRGGIFIVQYSVSQSSRWQWKTAVTCLPHCQTGRLQHVHMMWMSCAGLLVVERFQMLIVFLVAAQDSSWSLEWSLSLGEIYVTWKYFKQKNYSQHKPYVIAAVAKSCLQSRKLVFIGLKVTPSAEQLHLLTVLFLCQINENYSRKEL